MTVETFTLIINRLLPEPHAGLLSGILFGTKASLDADLYQALINSGTLHITALSGANISILINLAIPPLLLIFSRKNASLLACGIIIGFILLVGPTPSVIRAGLMGSLSLIATALGKQTWALWFWIVTAISMLLLSPHLISDVSFQLSTLATLGIILFAGKTSKIDRTNMKNIYMTKRTNQTKNNKEIHHTTMLPCSYTTLSWFIGLHICMKLVRFLWYLVIDDIRLTLAAQVFTFPIMIFTFHRISFIAPLSNLLIVWLLPPLTVIGLAICTIGLIWFPLAIVPSWIAWLMLEYMLIVIDLTGKIPFGNVGW